MASGDLSTFNAAKNPTYYFSGWATTDTIKLALLTSATAPSDATATPALADFTEVTAGGNYTAGGETLDTIANMYSESGGVVTIDDTGASVVWLADALNPTNARYGLIYNDTHAGDVGIAWIDLGADRNMTTGDLTITWDASGITTIT